MTENNISTSQDWFASWFDTPYYHILYKNRNNEEAQLFIDNLTHYLNLPENATILDLACGKGRHAIYLNSLGYKVTGLDLSENSIKEASKYSNETLDFQVHDMREPYRKEFDAVFNLFTSFGYFEDVNDNQKVLSAIKTSINEYGFGVIDFFNAEVVLQNLKPEETKVIDGIEFRISKYQKNGFIHKEIRFEAEGKQHFYTEKVACFFLTDFEKMIEEAGMYLLDVFGDYKLKKFYKNESERLILIFK
jgi:SAM-dependent methyltransferase